MYPLVIYVLGDRFCYSVTIIEVIMSCYYPVLLQLRGDPLTGEAKYKWTGTRFPRSDLDKLSTIKNDPNYKLAKCGKCIGCKLDHSREWADRMMIELDHSKKAVFLTLTYDDDHVHKAKRFGLGDKDFFYTLDKTDIQLFNKRLRDRLGYEKIRFYLCGEYGPQTLRPHYHGIYYGLGFEDIPDIKFRKFNKSGQPLYHSEWLDSIWQNGDVTIGHVSWQDCAYCARYTLKKQGNAKCSPASDRGCLPEFAQMSLKPGIGGFFPYDHPEFYQNPTDKIYLSDPHGLKHVNEVSCPKYLFDKMNAVTSKDMLNLGIVNPELYGKIKEQRQQFSEDRFFAELMQTDLSEFEYMDLKCKSHENRTKSLSRSLE